MFHYPLTIAEIYHFLGRSSPETEVKAALDILVALKQVFRSGDFYSLRNEPAEICERRKRGNARAEQLLPIAGKVGRRLARFPFVRAVGVSGSLSKNYADETADIDFFIITAAGRLWIARTLLHILKKFSFLTGRQHWYCMNYFIDEKALMMPEQNIFIATEIVTLIPVYGDRTFTAFLHGNNWVQDHLPNASHTSSVVKLTEKDPWYKKMIERFFANGPGERLDNYLMRLTGRRWMKKEHERKLNIKKELMSLRLGKHFCRPNPEHFQKHILQHYARRIEQVETQYQFQSPYFLRREII